MGTDKFVALTFDDGPCESADYGGTEGLLSALDALKIKATFFVIGQNVRKYKNETTAIFKAGHELANHSDDHCFLGDKDEADVARNIDAASSAIAEITGSAPNLFRPPFMNYGIAISRVCKQKGLALIDGIAHNDWPGNKDMILESVLSNPRDGDIIILHENATSHGNAVAALPQIASGLRERGFTILTVGQLAKVKGITLMAGERYGVLG
jgi:peptidoglycan/xylan/chitin deacetylase (PgdA/CDA1 family)